MMSSKASAQQSSPRQSANKGLVPPKYNPLNSVTNIRLFDLSPGQIGDQLRGVLRQVNLSDDIQYSALSYTWGSDSKSPRTLWVDDRLCSVRDNLFAALQALRKSSSTTTLWVDALCINQDDTKEKSHQVSMMADIYQQASSVETWLGVASDESDLAFKYMAQYQVDDAIKDIQRRGHQIPLRKSIGALLERNYWARAWIRQEVIIAKKIKVRCGKRVVEWDRFANWANYAENPLSKPAMPLIIQRKMTNSLKSDETLEMLIRKYWNAGCLDRRDRIYALLSLASDCQADHKIRADYNIHRIELLIQVLDFCKPHNSIDFTFLLLNTLDDERSEPLSTTKHREDSLRNPSNKDWSQKSPSYWTLPINFVGRLGQCYNILPETGDRYRHMQVVTADDSLRAVVESSDGNDDDLVFRVENTDVAFVLKSESISKSGLFEQSNLVEISVSSPCAFFGFGGDSSVCCIVNNSSIKVTLSISSSSESSDLEQLSVSIDSSSLVRTCHAFYYRDQKSFKTQIAKLLKEDLSGYSQIADPTQVWSRQNMSSQFETDLSSQDNLVDHGESTLHPIKYEDTTKEVRPVVSVSELESFRKRMNAFVMPEETTSTVDGESRSVNSTPRRRSSRISRKSLEQSDRANTDGLTIHSTLKKSNSKRLSEFEDTFSSQFTSPKKAPRMNRSSSPPTLTKAETE